MNVLLELRNRIGRGLSRTLIAKPFSVISDDCWGGQIYRHLRLPYATPTAGLYIEPKQYLDFVLNLRQPDAAALTFISSLHSFPVADTPYARLYFMHYASAAEAQEKFSRRFRRIIFDNLFVKIDFGKQGFSASDLARWNSLRLADSLALYPSGVARRWGPVFHGVETPDWVRDGAAMFDISRKHFDLHRWLSHGGVGCSASYRWLNFLFLDPSAPGRLKRRMRRTS